MKKILIILASLFVLTVFTGCDSSFLDREPVIEIGDGDIYTDADRIESTLLGLYAQLKMDMSRRAFIGGKTLVALDNRGEDLRNVGGNNVTLTATYEMRTTDVDTENNVSWLVAYRAINAANTFLAKIEEAQEVLGDSYEQLRAEAKFVRALAYYYLCGLWSIPYSVDPNAKAVPLRIQAEANTENNDLARSTISQVYDFILTEDLSDAAINALPQASNSYDAVSRATQGAAHMLRMRIKMAMEDYVGAIADGTAVTGYTLATDIASVFAPPYYTTENIFSFAMADNNTPNTQYGMVEYYNGGTVIMVVEEQAPGIMSEPLYSQAADARNSSFVVQDGANKRLVKFPTALKTDWVPIFRYSETLLNLAECYAAQGGNDATAAALLKQVRRRSIAAVDDALTDAAIDALTGQALKDAIYKERRLEFIGEGIRGLDIVRRGETFAAKTGVDAIAPTDANYIWPMPSSEKASNKAIND